MSERFLSDLLREAPKPRRVPWYARNGWAVPVGLCVGFAAYSILWDQRVATGAGFAVAGWLIWRMFRGVE